MARLTAEQDGEVPAALSHPAAGDIDVMWGEAPSTPGGNDGYGLAKIVAKHPEVLERLPELLAEMDVRSLSPNRIILESADNKAAIRLDYEGQQKTWLLSAYAKAAPETAVYPRAASKGQAGSPDAGRGDKIGDPAAGGNAGETFDPTPHLPAARQYLAGNGSLRPEAVGRALGLPPAEAERVLGAQAARRDGGRTAEHPHRPDPRTAAAADFAGHRAGPALRLIGPGPPG